MPSAYFVVRATVADPAKRRAFDEWYSREHMPDAAKVFGAVKAWRFWSVIDPSLHEAMYEFADRAALDRVMGGDELKRLVAAQPAKGSEEEKSLDARSGAVAKEG